jgi:hypothetical protein
MDYELTVRCVAAHRIPILFEAAQTRVVLPKINDSTNRTRNSKNNNLAIHAAVPAIPANPSNPARSAMIKKLSDQPNIGFLSRRQAPWPAAVLATGERARSSIAECFVLTISIEADAMPQDCRISSTH